MQKQMSDENFSQKIKDINKFDFNKYLPKPAVSGTAPKPAVGRVITLDEMIENGTVPETKPVPKPAANGTGTETKAANAPELETKPKPAASGTAPKPAVPEAKPGVLD